MPGRLRLLFALLFALLVAVVPARPAFAHADLVATEPAAGELVETAPEQLTLQFTEDVTLQPDGVRVIDRDAERADRGDASSEGSTVVVPLRDDVADGTYVVAWRVVSADGHPVRGAYTFSIGTETEVATDLADQAFASGGDRTYEQLAALLRVLTYLGVLGTCGYVLIAAALGSPGDPSPVSRTTTLVAVGSLVAMALQVPLQAALASGRGLTSVTDASVLAQALADGAGFAALVTTLGLAAVIITAGLPWADVARKVGLAGALVAPLGFVISGHTRTMDPVVAGMVADAAHLLAATMWFGGLLALLAVVRWRRSDDDPLGAAEALARFSGWAALSLVAVAASGLALGLLEVGSLEALTTTTYGRLLMAKVALVAVVVAVAGWNRLRLVPRVASASLEEPPRDDRSAWRLLLRLVVAEVVILVGVIAVTGVLVNVTPAKAAVTSDRPVTVSGPIAQGTMDVTVDPARPGRNDVHIYLLDEDGSPAEQYTEATARLELPAQALGPFDVEPVRVGPGHFQLVAADLALAGEWQLTVTVKPDRFTEQTGVVQFPVG
jgi:copper transport protein